MSRLRACMRALLSHSILFLGLPLLVAGLAADVAVGHRAGGIPGTLAAIAVAPATFLAAPFYALARWGTWWLPVLQYGGSVILLLALLASELHPGRAGISLGNRQPVRDAAAA